MAWRFKLRSSGAVLIVRRHLPERFWEPTRQENP
jgi:hypothetical protein